MHKLLPAPLLLMLLAGCAKPPEKVVEKPKPKSAYLVYVTNEGSGDMTVIDRKSVV